MTYLWNQRNFNTKPDGDITREPSSFAISLMNIDVKALKKENNKLNPTIYNAHNQAAIHESKVSFNTKRKEVKNHMVFARDA